MAETREPRTDEEMARLTQYFPEVERRRVRYLAPEQLEALFQSAEVFEHRMQNQVQSSLSHQLQEQRNTSALDQENQHYAKELTRRSRFKAHTTSHWLDQRKVCGNCWYTYKQSWALGHWNYQILCGQLHYMGRNRCQVKAWSWTAFSGHTSA